jgi:large subunit ribosomal protein L9
MKLILLEKVTNLGDLGETVEVKSGYGRNFLMPKGMAVAATRENVAMFEERRAELEAAAQEKLSQAQARADRLREVVLKIEANASDEGNLFGSIGPREIADAVTETGVELEKSEVIMGEGPIRATGAYDVMVQLHADVVTEIKVIVNEDQIIAKVADDEVEEVLDYDAAEAEVVEAVIDDTVMEGVTPEEAAALDVEEAAAEAVAEEAEQVADEAEKVAEAAEEDSEARAS